MRIKDYTDMIGHLTDSFNIPEARRIIAENPALTQEQFTANRLKWMEEPTEQAPWDKPETPWSEEPKEPYPWEAKEGGAAQLVQPGPGRQGYQGKPNVKPRIRRGSTLDKIFPKLEKRAIELLNTGLAPIDVSRQLEQEGIIKPATFKRVIRPGRGDDPKLLKKSYQPFNNYYKNLLATGQLKIKKLPIVVTGTLKPQEEIIKLDNIIAKTFKKNPNLSSIRIAKLVSTQTGQKVGPEMVITALKRSNIDYISKDRKILPEIEKLDKLVKNNARFLSGKASLEGKRKFLFDAFKKAIGDKTFDTHAFGYRLDRLGQLYAGTGKDRSVDKIYKNIKSPKNYLDSNLHKNVMGMLQHQTRGIIGTAELLGLPPKDIDLSKRSSGTCRRNHHSWRSYGY